MTFTTFTTLRPYETRASFSQSSFGLLLACDWDRPRAPSASPGPRVPPKSKSKSSNLNSVLGSFRLLETMAVWSEQSTETWTSGRCWQIAL